MRTGWHCSSTISITNAEKVGNLLSPCLAWFSRTLVPYLEWAQLGRILTSFLLSFSLFNGPYPQLTAFLICKFLSSQQTPLKHFHPSMKSSIIVLTCLERPEQQQKGVQIVSLNFVHQAQTQTDILRQPFSKPQTNNQNQTLFTVSLPVYRLHNKF